MTPRPDRSAALSLEAEVAKELAFAPEIERYLAKALRALEQAPPDVADLAASAVGHAAADVYLLAENVLKTIAREFEGVPSGPEWHKRLLDRARLDIPGIRPPIISDATRAALDPLRDFRHVIRNVYGMRIDPVRARQRAEQARRALPAFEADIAAFCRFLDALASA